MTPGKLRNDPAHWQPQDRRRTDHAPDALERDGAAAVVAVLGLALVAGGILALVAVALGLAP